MVKTTTAPVPVSTSPVTTPVAAPKTRLNPLLSLRTEMDDLFNKFLGRIDDSWFIGRMSPLADVSETDTTIEVSMDLPGVTANEIEVHLTGNTLYISGERKEEKEEKGKTMHRVERRRGSFARTIALPCPVVGDEVIAAFKNGVLTVTLPKSEEAQNRKIPVKV